MVGIKKWGNNLGVRLPGNVARAAHLPAEQMVRVTVGDDGITITPLPDAAPTLAQRLARFDPARHGGEAMAADPVGAEKW
ncbi:AbrB/MazE/SpoVT family DNA-binding domain-containing protein [Oryzisolibacter propanilivorax]|uniref:AbrB/MazE/SpoVT family DNA-binding domain-containing protein n=1 Tax=Oryzisolibacter propanilivorax TaxID=1527607 RepID=UPI001C317F51